MSTQTGDVLRRAADELELNGWCQGTLHRRESSCLVGAVRRAVEVPASRFDTHQDLADLTSRALTALTNWVGPFPSVWNDMAGRTRAEVVKVLLAGADAADIREES